jgi:hypothetical protein
MARGSTFESFRPKADGFLETVEGAWSSTPPIENPFKRLAAKLSAMAKVLSSWSDKFNRNNKLQILVANKLISDLTCLWIQETRALLEERGFRCMLKWKLLGLASLERTIARHHSRIHWFNEGALALDSSTRTRTIAVLELCPRGNNKDAIIIILIYDNVYILC